MNNDEEMDVWIKEILTRLKAIETTLSNLAKIVKIAPKSVYRWAYERKVTSVKIGGRRLFYAKDVLEHQKERR